MEAAAGQLKEAEKKLLECVHHSGKNSYLRLASLNGLIDVELQLHNDSKAKSLIKEAGADGEAVSSTAVEHANPDNVPLLEEARKAIFRWADSYAEVGSYDSARTLYRKAQIVEQGLGKTVKAEDSAESRLQKLDERIRGEKHALEHDDGLADTNDPGYQARKERTAEKKKLLEQMREIHLEIARKPSKQLADRALSLLPQLLTTYGVREIEYRGALNAAVQFSFLHGDRAKALSLLNDDMSKFENISDEGIHKADPTTLENANYMITDLAQLSTMYLQIGEYVEAAKPANRAIEIAQRVHSPDMPQLTDCLKAIAVEKEQHTKRTESIPIRQQQIDMLKRLHLTDNYPPYYEAHLELGRTLAFDKKYKEALPHIDYAIARLYANQPDEFILPYALTAKGQLLFDSGDYAGARQALSKARILFDRKGTAAMRFSCYRLLTQCLRQMNLLKEAQEAGKSALAYAQQLTEHRDQGISDCCLELTTLADYLGNNKEALAYVKQTLEHQVKATGEITTTVAGLLNYEATLETRIGHPKEAEKLRLKAIEICRQENSADKTALVSSILQLANFYSSRNQSDKAIPLYREVLVAAEGQTSSDCIHFLRMSRIELAILLRDKAKVEAEKLKNLAIAKLPTTSQVQPIQDCNFFASLGDLCLDMHDYKNAEMVFDMLGKAYEKAETTKAENRRALAAFKEVLLSRKRDLYKVTKREKLAQEMSAQLELLKNASQKR